MHLEKRGAGARSVLFVHGTPGDRSVFARVAAMAPSDVTVGLLDLPDHGAAPPELEARIEPLEEAVCEAVGALPGAVTVVGHSFGAWLAASVSGRLPARAERFVSLAGMAAMTEEDLALRRQLLQQLEEGAVTPPELAEACLGMFFGEERTDDLVELARPTLELSHAQWQRLLRRALRTGDRAPVRFEGPVVVVHGTREGTLPFSHAEALARSSTDATLVPVETTSHMLPLTHPDLVAAHAFAAP